MEDDDDFLGLEAEETITHESEEAEPQERDEAEAEFDAGDHRERDEKGRFVPVSALKGVRKDFESKIERIEREKRELAERLDRIERSQQQPQGEQYQLTPEQQRDLQLQNERLDLYEEIARDRFGDEVIDEAQKWFQELTSADPQRAQAIQSARNPYKALIQHFHRELELEEMEELRQSGFDPADPDEWVLNRAREIIAARRGAPAQQPASQTAPPPRSLATAPSSGGGAGAVRTGPGTAFDDVFS